MKRFAIALALLSEPALAQQPNGTINAPIYATGYISQVGGTNVTTTIKSQPNYPINLNIYTTGAISGTWTIKLPNPAFEGQMLSFNCGAAVNAISVTSSDGSSIDSTLPTACGINSGFTVQFDQRSNIWRNLGSSNTATFKPFTGVASQWPWQLNADGSWTLKQPTFADIASGIANNAVTISGTISSNYYLHSITLTDNAAMGSNYAYPLFVSHNVGATSTGIKPGATFQLLFTAPTANLASSFYSPMSTSAVAGASDGGVLGAPRSFLYGANPASRLQSTATYWAGVIGQDSIASIATGGSAYRRVGHVSESEGYVRGLSIDAAYGILANLGNPNGAVQWTTGILFDDSQGLLPSSGGQYPIVAGGTLIQGAYSGSGVSISGGLYAGINFAMFSSAWQQAAILLPAVDTGSIVSSTTTGAGALTFGNGVTTVSSGAGIAVHVDSNGLAFDYAGGSTCTATGSIQVTINGAIKRIPYC